MQMHFKKSLFLFSLYILTAFTPSFKFHPYYVSVTEIEHNKKEKTLEISCKIFTDDFEKTLRQNYRTNIDLLNPKDKTKTDKLVADYIKKHLQIIVNGRLLKLEFSGYESEGEAIWSYFEVKDISTVKNIEIKDDLLYEYKKEQINLLHVTVNSKRKSIKLNNPESKASFKW